jgi:hypothetical protein
VTKAKHISARKLVLLTSAEGEFQKTLKSFIR